MTFKVEYLITYNIKGSSLQTIENYKYLLMSNALINFENSSIQFDNINFDFELVIPKIIDKNQRTFKIIISTDDISLIDKLSELLKIIRELSIKTEGKITILWDEISNHYSVLAYPEINNIENLLRKLISYFMVTNFGLEWVEETIPMDVKNSVKKNRDKNNFLHNTDFIQLSEFLFKPYSSKNIELLITDIKEKKLKTELDYNYFDQFIPKSNWERYFNSFVEYEDTYLSKNWSKLYELRCLIAHNNFLKKNEYEEIIRLVNDLKDKFLKAIESIEKIIIPIDEKDIVLENVLQVRNEKLIPFFKEWQDIFIEVRKLYKPTTPEEHNNTSLSQIAKYLNEKGIVTENFCTDLKTIEEFRNKLSHVNDILLDEDIEKYTKLAKMFYVDKFIFGDDIIS